MSKIGITSALVALLFALMGQYGLIVGEEEMTKTGVLCMELCIPFLGVTMIAEVIHMIEPLPSWG